MAERLLRVTDVLRVFLESVELSFWRLEVWLRPRRNFSSSRLPNEKADSLCYWENGTLTMFGRCLEVPPGGDVVWGFLPSEGEM